MPIWRLVLDGGIALSEIQRWDLEDVFTALAYLEMKHDHEAVYHLAAADDVTDKFKDMKKA